MHVCKAVVRMRLFCGYCAGIELKQFKFILIDFPRTFHISESFRFANFRLVRESDIRQSNLRFTYALAIQNGNKRY